MNDPGPPLALSNSGLLAPVRPEDKDEFYHDVLDGLSVFLGSAYIVDVTHALKTYPIPRLSHSLNPAQVACKRWLLDTLCDAGAAQFGRIYVLGGWYGVLGAMFLHDPRFNVDKVVSIDIDPQCRSIAEALNRSGVENGRFESLTADAYELDYPGLLAGGPDSAARPDLLVNTSCEHLTDFDRWYAKIPRGTLLALQSNDYFDCEEHDNCVPDIESFARQAPMAERIYEGHKKLRKYTRFMLIGRK
jgi:hypothetical protein